MAILLSRFRQSLRGIPILPLLLSLVPPLASLQLIRRYSLFEVIGEDAWKWINWGMVMARGDFSIQTPPFKSPFYPYILSILFDAGFPYIEAGFLISFLSLFLFTLFMILCGKRLEGAGGAIFSFLLVLSSLPLLGYSLHLQPDGLFIAIESLALFSALSGIARPLLRLTLLQGGLLFVLSFTKVNGILLIPPLFLINLLAAILKERGILRRLLHPLLFFTGFSLSLFLAFKLPPLKGIEYRNGLHIFFREEVRLTIHDSRRLSRGEGVFFPSLFTRLNLMSYKDDLLMDLSSGRERRDFSHKEFLLRYARFNLYRLYREMSKVYPVILPLSLTGLLSLLLLGKDDRALKIIASLLLLTPLLPMMVVWWEERHILFLYPILILFSIHTVSGIRVLLTPLKGRRILHPLIFSLILVALFLTPVWSARKYLPSWLRYKIRNVEMLRPLKVWIEENTGDDDFIMADDASLAVMTGRRYMEANPGLCVEKALPFMREGDNVYLIVSEEVSPSVLMDHPHFASRESPPDMKRPYILAGAIRCHEKDALIYRWDGSDPCFRRTR